MPGTRQVFDETVDRRPKVFSHSFSGDGVIPSWVTVAYIASAGAAFTVELPPVAEKLGFLAIHFRRVTAHNGTLVHQGDSLNWGNLTFNADNEYALLWSDGVQWFVLSTNT